MKTVYDVIDVLLEWRGFTMKQLAQNARIPYTTFASLMKRRPLKIAQKTLILVGKVFGVEGHELLGLSIPFEPEQEYNGRNINGERIGVVMEEEAFEYVLKRIIGDEYRMILDRIEEKQRVDILEYGEGLYPVKSDLRRRFDSCVDVVFDHLNEPGVIEAMRYILELSQNPRFSEPLYPRKKKEDTEWQKEKLPTAAEQSD